MRVDSFARTLIYGALAAVLLPCAALAFGGMPGVGGGVGLYLVGSAGLYVAGLAPERRSWVYALGLGALALPILALTTTLSQAAFIAALVLSAGRLMVAGRARLARAWPKELVLTGGGLVLALGVATHSMQSFALALWSFFLVQSLGFLLPADPTLSAGELDGQDPFERARASLLDLLAEEPRS